MKESTSPKVLLVDDEQVHRYMLYSMFTQWDWSCREGDDGVTAVEAVRQGSFDVVLMDVRMTNIGYAGDPCN